MTRVSTKNVTIHTLNGRDIVLKLGQTITKSQLNRMTDSQIKKYTEIQSPLNVRYTRDELIELVSLYLINDNVSWVRDQYLTLNPDTPHTSHSINSCIGQIRSLDNHHPNDTKWVVKSLVMSVCQELNSDRFINDELSFGLSFV